MGSGKFITRSIKKHGLENFEKEILFIFETEAEMNAKEAELVTEEFVKEDSNYNLCPGGHGGWGYLNINGLNNAGKDWNIISPKISKKLKGVPRPDISERNKKAYAEGKRTLSWPFTESGRKEMQKRSTSLEANKKRSNTMKRFVGSKNSQYKTIWITDGKYNRKIKNTDDAPEGWIIGRTYPPILDAIQMCAECKKIEKNANHLYWWDLYIQSHLSVSAFVKEIYPYNRASFYNMKARIENLSN